MQPIATYVFLDLETTSLPCEDNNRSKITELALVVVKRDHVLDTHPGATPRVQHKLTLCLNPSKLINPTATDITGLSNDLLEYEPVFDMQVFTTINTFLNILTKPVCLIAQNGHNFDFPILKNHFEKLKVNISDDILCADSLHAFYDIEKSNNLSAKHEKVIEIKTQQTFEGKFSDSFIKKSNNSSMISDRDATPGTCKDKESGSHQILEHTDVKDDTDFYNSPKSMQAVNEITPKHQKIQKKQSCKQKIRRRLFWENDKKPTQSYKLKDVYMRVLNRTAINAHRAESDCNLTLEVAVALGQVFVDWIDKNNSLFSDVMPMTIGVPLGE